MSHEKDTAGYAGAGHRVSTDHPFAALPRLVRQRYRTRVRSEIPILDMGGSIIAWTPTAPSMGPGCVLRHAEAENLLGGRVTCRLVTVTGAAALRAGSPFAEAGWSCFAIVPDHRSVADHAAP